MHSHCIRRQAPPRTAIMLMSPFCDHAETNAGQSRFQRQCTTISARMQTASLRCQSDSKVRFLQLSPAGRHSLVTLRNHQCHNFRFVKKQNKNHNTIVRYRTIHQRVKSVIYAFTSILMKNLLIKKTKSALFCPKTKKSKKNTNPFIFLHS